MKCLASPKTLIPIITWKMTKLEANFKITNSHICSLLCLPLSLSNSSPFSALTLVVQVEAMELVPNLSNPEMSSKVENVDLFTGTSNNKFLTGIFFEFCHSILLQFVAEELSQVLPFPLFIYKNYYN